MTDLLDFAIQAHGGFELWQRIEQLRAHIKVGGAVWHVKGWPDAYADIHTMVSTRRPYTEFTPFLEKGYHCVWEAERTAIVADSGEVIEHRVAPRSSFEGHTIATAWDRQHLIYFTGYAMWTYLTTPFLFRLPGFETEEIEPWQEEDEIWRRLRVTFPLSVPSHSTAQTFYFESNGLLRRHDYSVDIMGGTTSANYASDHESFAGLTIPTKRRVYTTGADNRPILDRVAVSNDLLDVVIEPQPAGR
ncbi:hypothetical protein [Rhizobium sp. MHM7A]|uniref:hypothetical protein n=1 Tax=Rhizobium sp. MHM7A TaxID=2583233 RepID=UPI00110587F3|nr:hypothetical protein [Rhizobium sp. MHM7A]TLX12999.1 hypothetical protein FFR93_14030 [Rhizobium sp. MHM7A]